MISVICVYNNKKILDSWILKSLKNQISDYELILLDNTDNKFESAANALNYGVEKSNGNYLMFVHQDVKLCSNDWLIKAEDILEKIKNLGIAGVAGIGPNSTQIKNIIYAYENPIVKYGSKIQAPEVVQTLDECLIIIPKNIIQKYKFDEKTCDDWHFYAVDYCLSINNMFGKEPFVIPLQVHHQSLGFSKKLRPKISSIRYLKDYYHCLNKIITKHNQNYDWIFTTSGNYKTSSNLIIQDFKRFFNIIRNK